ncbi:MAG: SAM-dependent methyltransferase [bacterium]
MDEGQPSNTAQILARHRALHLMVDGDPKIYGDRLAMDFLGSEEITRLEANPEIFQTPQSRSLRAVAVLRQRYVEDELAKAVQRGVSQYVILGAGLDPFAYQRPDSFRALRIFEVDHPLTQQWKRRRLEQLDIAIPNALTFIPIDFDVQTLAEGMAASTFSEKDAAFFSWLGVTQYLTEAAVFGTLAYVASHTAPGSEIVFQIILPASSLNAEDKALVSSTSQRAAGYGEPWLSYFEPEEIETRLKGMGFGNVVHFGAKEASAKYFQGRTDGLTPPNYFALIQARVGP